VLRAGERRVQPSFDVGGHVRQAAGVGEGVDLVARGVESDWASVRVPAKIVPAVTEVSDRQAAQRRSPSAICHQPPSTAPQKRQLKPSPQRSRSK
jgi:hypothetical protein